ncbi:phage regulatory protein, rha family [Xylanibacter ruminicola]|uniref:Phage regulatory protein, rha family n=2 Tax=Xylanibacter ruminicola TaxID=839 RepID=A0A1M6TIE9_XYLRU|nr:phage regulatory protein, rha family [Xylanibacter ruminicola]
MTSLEIAELTGKQHKNLMRDIRNMEPAWEKVHGLKFELIEYKDRLGRIKPCYSLTKTETLYIATKFNDEVRAKQFSIALKGAGVTRNSVQQMLKNWRIQGLVEQMDDGRYKKEKEIMETRIPKCITSQAMRR